MRCRCWRTSWAHVSSACLSARVGLLVHIRGALSFSRSSPLSPSRSSRSRCSASASWTTQVETSQIRSDNHKFVKTLARQVHPNRLPPGHLRHVHNGLRPRLETERGTYPCTCRGGAHALRRFLCGLGLWSEEVFFGDTLLVPLRVT